MRSCLILIDEDWQNVVNPDDRILMIDEFRFGKRLVVLCAVIVYMSGVAYRMFVPLSVGKIVTPQNIHNQTAAHSDLPRCARRAAQSRLRNRIFVTSF